MFENMNETITVDAEKVKAEMAAIEKRAETIFVTEDTEPKAEEAVQ